MLSNEMHPINAEEPTLEAAGMLMLVKALASLHIESGTYARFGASMSCKYCDPLNMPGAALVV